MRFTHRGRNYRLDPQTVQRLLRGVEPEATRLWWVEVNGVRYPVNQAFEVASGIHRSTYSTDLPQRTLRRLGFPVGKATTEPVTPRGPREAAPSMETDREALIEAATELVLFLREQSLSKTLPATESSLLGGDRDTVRRVRAEMAATRPMVDVARLLWRERSKLKDIADATTVMLAIEGILEDGEEILQAPSLHSAPTPGRFDLSTSVRVANFELRSLEKDINRRTLFARFVELAMEPSGRVAQLWVGPIAEARRFLFDSDEDVAWGLARSSRTLRERFQARYGSLSIPIAEFTERYAQHVQVRDMRPVVASISH